MCMYVAGWVQSWRGTLEVSCGVLQRSDGFARVLFPRSTHDVDLCSWKGH